MKKCWQIGTNVVVVIDKSIVNELGINTDDIFLEQGIVEDGILMRIHKLEK